MKTPETFYKYRAFDTLTLLSLCEDTLYFSNPGDFNDPLDCSPTINCDSTKEELRKLLAFFTSKRVTTEILEHLRKAKIKVSNASEHASTIARKQTLNELANIAYMATDPEYGGQTLEAELHMLVEAIERELRGWFERGVCCLSTTYSNPLLWSHYGQQHKGLCIGYTTERVPVPRPQKVVYGGNRAINTSKLCKAFLENDIQSQTDVDSDVLLKKAKGWEYESEWRLIDEQGLQTSPMLMTEITFGLRCNSSVMHSVIKALEGRKNIKYYEMYTVKNTFALRRKLVDIDELQHNLPNVAMSGHEIFGDI